MLFFPQFDSLTSSQYPARRRSRFRTVRNVLSGGKHVSYFDGGLREVEWSLPLERLSDSERASVEILHAAASGRLLTFTFLDPFENLLKQSENLGSAVWQKDPGMVLTSGIAAPDGSTGGYRAGNQGVVPMRLFQTIPAAAWFHYCLSVHVRAGAGTLFRDGALKAVDAGAEWRRIQFSNSSNSVSEQFEIGVELEPGAEIELFGWQLEAQPAPGSYMKTTTRSGIYDKARFGEDELQWKTEDVGAHSAILTIVSVDHA